MRDSEESIDDLGQAPQLRELVYAALLRYSPEVQCLRERALDKLVLAGLLESSAATPYRAGKIKDRIKSGSALPAFRTDTILEALERLKEVGFVEKTKLHFRNAYYLTETGHKELAESVRGTARDFQRAIYRLSADLVPRIPREVAEAICRSFLAHCFATMGRNLASIVLGREDVKALAGSYGVRNAFELSVKNHQLHDAEKQSLFIRLRSFLTSDDPEDARVKYWLAQAYYLAQLLEVQSDTFNPIAEEAFRGAVFYLDTNVIIPVLADPAENRESFEEIGRISVSLGIELRATRETINEARAVAASKLESLIQVVNSVPEELARKESHDEFLAGFIHARDENPELTPEQFLSPFDQLAEYLQEQLGVQIEDVIADEVLDGSDYSSVAQILQDSAVQLRKVEKRDAVLRHDVCHVLLVGKERQRNGRAWFLTRDRTLYHAGQRLAEDGELPFCYPMLGLLQSLCPFIQGSANHRPLAGFFEDLLVEQLAVGEAGFDLSELALLAEMHEDVLATPLDRLIPALDHVRQNVLAGRQFRRENAPKVALELKKHLYVSASERESELRSETEALRRAAAEAERVADTQERLRVKAESQRDAHASRLEAIESKVAVLARNEESQAREIERLKKRRQIEHRLAYTVIGLVGAILIWAFDKDLFRLAGNLVGRQSSEGVAFGVSLVSIAVFLAPAALLLRLPSWSGNVKKLFFGACVVIALIGSNIVASDLAQKLSGYVSIALAIVAILPLAALNPKDEGR